MTKENFLNLIDQDKNRIQNFTNKLLKNEIREDRIPSIKRMLFSLSLGVTISKVSAKYDLQEIKEEFGRTLTYMDNSWGEGKDFLYGNDPEPYFSTDQYWDLLTILSLGILLDVSEQDFSRITHHRDVISQKDALLDFLINSYSPRPSTKELMNGNPFKSLATILEKNRKETVGALKIFLEKQWYSCCKKLSWYDSHKSKELTHFGYWSFESAAIVKIMGLDDSSLKDCQYYPYDLGRSDD